MEGRYTKFKPLKKKKMWGRRGARGVKKVDGGRELQQSSSLL